MILRKTMYSAFLLLLGVSAVYSDSHTLRIFDARVSDKVSGLPEYVRIGYVDDKKILNYNSDSQEARPVASWMDKEGPDFWESQTLRGKHHEVRFKHCLRFRMNRSNQTAGFHSYQWLIGCELRDDGSTVMFSQYGYDGKDLMHLDTERWVYIASMNEAQSDVQRLNSPEEQRIHRDKYYLESECIQFLKAFISHGKEDLEKKVPPEVKVISHRSAKGIKLHCWVYGFQPRAVDVKWMKNNEDEVPLDETRPILPNPDGTYQTRATVEVPARQKDSYSCHVDHSSLNSTLIVKWGPGSWSWHFGLIIGVLFISSLVIIGVIYIKLAPSPHQKPKGEEPEPRENPQEEHKALIESGRHQMLSQMAPSPHQKPEEEDPEPREHPQEEHKALIESDERVLTVDGRGASGHLDQYDLEVETQAVPVIAVE